MAAMAASASEDGTIGMKFMGPASSKKQRPEPPQLPVPCPSIAVFPMGENERGAMTDASKRRFDPETEAGLDDEFEMVTSEIVSGNVYSPTDVQIDLATMIGDVC